MRTGGRRLAGAAVPGAPPTGSVTLRDKQGMSPVLKWLFLALIVVGYALVAAAVALLASKSGNYLDGTDAMFYIHRGDFLYKSITREGNWFPLIDLSWYNGVETWRYWSPLPAYILAGCQALMGGSVNNGFLLFSGLLYFMDALVWLHIGRTHKRPWLGALMGALWFFVPNTSVYMLFSEGVLARAMTMPVLPLFFVYIHDYLYEPKKRWVSLPKIILCLLFMLWCHIGWAGMVAISLLIYLLFYFFSNIQKKGRVMVSPLIACVLLAFLLNGIALLPSLKGGITGINSSSVMATYFQPLLLSINPFQFVGEGFWNRWVYAETYYYGLVALLLTLLGILCSNKDTKPGFATALTILLMSTPAAYQILVHLPGSQYLWMARFLSIALCVFLVAAFFWRSLKKWILGLFSVLFSVEVLLIIVLVTHSTNPLSPDAYHDHLAEQMLIGHGQEITSQRMSMVDPFDTEIDGIYVSSSYGEKPVPTSFGQGVQAAPQYSNLVSLNQAAQEECYPYLFDRFLELGNDTIIIPVPLQQTAAGPVERDLDKLYDAAARVGYTQVDGNSGYMLFHLQGVPEGHWGVVSKYRAAAIGTGAGSITIYFPAAQELTGLILDEYTFDELKDYDVIYLAGFTYNDKEKAEQLLLDLSEAGTRIIIMADGIPDEEHTGSKTFLDVACNRVNFQNGYPALDTIDGVLYCDLFPSGYAEDWQTVYVNGLDEVWGTITDVPEGKMDFYGTAKNDNIIFIGLGLTYHYALTQDAAVGALLEHALQLSPHELPQREIVPLEVDYRDNVITIDSQRNDVNTTLAWHDIFRADRELRTTSNLVVVDEGRTVIRLVYPELIPGLAVTGGGLLLTVVYLILMKRRFKNLALLEAQEAELPGEEPAAPEAPVEETPEVEAEEAPGAEAAPETETAIDLDDILLPEMPEDLLPPESGE